MTAAWLGLLLGLAILAWPHRAGADRAVAGRSLTDPASGGSGAQAVPRPPYAGPGGRAAAGRAWAEAKVRSLLGPRDPSEDLAEFAELLALCLHSGLPPGEAVQIARQDGSWTHPHVVGTAELLIAGHRKGSAPRPVEGIDRETSSSLLVSAWELSLDCGAPLAEAVDASAGALRGEAAARRRAMTARAGPRASMWLLTVLPLGGPVAAWAVGADPTATFGQPVAVLSLASGLALTASGWWWSRRLLHRAEAATVF